MSEGAKPARIDWRSVAAVEADKVRDLRLEVTDYIAQLDEAETQANALRSEIDRLREGLDAARYAVSFLRSPHSDWAVANITMHYLFPNSEQLTDDAKKMIQQVRDDAERDAAWWREHLKQT